MLPLGGEFNSRPRTKLQRNSFAQELFGFSAKPSVAASLPMPKAPVSTTAENDSRLGVECISDAASRDASTLRKKGYMLPR